jgi:Co/Zn/Cd efflux system component
MNANLRKVVIIVAVLNLAYFGVEFAVARAIGSVSLFADSVDFLEDASVNFLIAMALGWNATNRARLGMALASILLIPASLRSGQRGRSSWLRCHLRRLP